jgi:hypothetical protein
MSGDFEMIRLDTGDRLIIKMDGSEIRDSILPGRRSFAINAIKQKTFSVDPTRHGDGKIVLWFCKGIVNEILDKHYGRV